MIYGIFHGDLHGGNLFVLPDGRSALLDFGITGRMTESSAWPSCGCSWAPRMNDVTVPARGVPRPRRPARPTPTSTAIIADLGLDGPPIDPTTLTPEELIGEIQRIIKALLGYGARMPKELMLFVKNMVFLDGAIATLAPDLDLFAEIATISMYFAETHGERIAAEVGIDPDVVRVRLHRHEGQLRRRPRRHRAASPTATCRSGAT